MILVAIESPLAGDFERNRRYALWCARDCYERGEAAYASHLFYPQLLDDTDPEQREYGIRAGLKWAQAAHLHAFYLDLGESGGMSKARKYWTSRNPRRLTEDRGLPTALMERFEAGEAPGATSGF